MTKKEALNALMDGHTIYEVAYAKKVCDKLKVKFNEKQLVKKFYSDKSGDPKGLRMNEGMEGMEGVYALELSRYVAEQFGVADKAGDFMGRGFQARAYAEQVAKVA